MVDFDDFDIQPRRMTVAELEAFEWVAGSPGIIPSDFVVHLVGTNLDEFRMGDGVTFMGTPFTGGAAVSRMRADTLLGPPFTGATPITNIAVVANTLYAFPVFMPRRKGVQRLIAHVDTAGAGGTLLRLGLYEDDNGQPGRLIVDGGTVSCASTGQKVLTVNSVVGRGWYWAVLCSDGAPQVRGYSVASYCGIGFIDDGTYLRISHLTRAFTFAALPASESAQTYTLASANFPAVWVSFN